MRLAGKRVFLSGPMTGIDHYNVAAFAEAHAICKEAGAETVYDPAHEWLTSREPEQAHEAYMSRCINVLTRTAQSRDDWTVTEPVWDALVQLDGWQLSDGATLEMQVARACGIPVVGIREVS